MGHSEYSKLKEQQANVENENKKFAFRFFPGKVTMLIMFVLCGICLGGYFLFASVLKQSFQARVFFISTIIVFFITLVLLLLSLVISIVWAANKLRLKHTITKLNKEEDLNGKNFEKQYFTTLDNNDNSIDK